MISNTSISNDNDQYVMTTVYSLYYHCHHCWLVISTPLKNMNVRMDRNNPFMFQPTNQIIPLSSLVHNVSI